MARFHPDHDRKGCRYADALPLIETLHARGVSLNSIAVTLNALGIPGARHGRWHPTSVKMLIESSRSCAPESPELVDPREIEEYEEHERRLFEAEVEEVYDAGGDVPSGG